MEKILDYQDRLLKAIPGGAHTYSRGYDQFPENAPQILKRGKGAYVFDESGTQFLDYGMALRAINIGYSEEEINKGAIEQIEFGNNLTRASMIELEAAEMIIDLIDSVEMVKFTKNGSTAVSAAVKLARACTGRDLVARCADHPFFSYDDWFIGSTPMTKGIPESVVSQTKIFKYNEIASLEDLIQLYPDEISCVVLEPSTTVHPVESKQNLGENFLHDVQRLCKKHGIVFILDEMITGFRWHLKGAQFYYNVKPDLCTFGKAMANGFSVAAIGGCRSIMEQGSIEKIGAERLFLLSTTHGAEMCGLGAFVKTVLYIQNHNVIDHLWSYGHELINMLNTLAAEFGLDKNFVAGGIDCSPIYTTFDHKGEVSLELRTLFLQEMVKSNILIPWIALCYRHGENELRKTAEAVEKTFSVYKKAIEEGSTEPFLKGKAVRPVFRRFN